MYLPCTCHVLAMYLPCTCHVLDMYLPCTCHVLAMYLPRTCHVLAMYLPCTCHVPLPMLPLPMLLLNLTRPNLTQAGTLGLAAHWAATRICRVRGGGSAHRGGAAEPSLSDSDGRGREGTPRRLQPTSPGVYPSHLPTLTPLTADGPYHRKRLQPPLDPPFDPPLDPPLEPSS